MLTPQYLFKGKVQFLPGLQGLVLNKSLDQFFFSLQEATLQKVLKYLEVNITVQRLQPGPPEVF